MSAPLPPWQAPRIALIRSAAEAAGGVTYAPPETSEDSYPSGPV